MIATRLCDSTFSISRNDPTKNSLRSYEAAACYLRTIGCPIIQHVGLHVIHLPSSRENRRMREKEYKKDTTSFDHYRPMTFGKAIPNFSLLHLPIPSKKILDVNNEPVIQTGCLLLEVGGGLRRGKGRSDCASTCTLTQRQQLRLSVESSSARAAGSFACQPNASYYD